MRDKLRRCDLCGCLYIIFKGSIECPHCCKEHKKAKWSQIKVEKFYKESNSEDT